MALSGGGENESSQQQPGTHYTSEAPAISHAIYELAVRAAVTQGVETLSFIEQAIAKAAQAVLDLRVSAESPRLGTTTNLLGADIVQAEHRRQYSHPRPQIQSEQEL